MMIVSLLISCSDERPQFQSILNDRVDVTFSLDMPVGLVATRADDNQLLESLFAVVFDKNGMLTDYSEVVRPHWNKEQGNYEASISLLQTEEERYVHLVGNCERPAKISFSYEEDIMKQFQTTAELSDDGRCIKKTNPGFWQCVKMPDGIKENSVIKANLVRNRAMIDVEVDESLAQNFRLRGFAVVNVPDRGALVPYNNMTEKDYPRFVEFKENSLGNLDYDEINKDYHGYLPNETKIIKNLPNVSEIDCSPKYIYECPFMPGNKHTAILIKGRYSKERIEPDDSKWQEIETTYYKIDLVHKPKDDFRTIYYDLLRNFRYKVKICKVITKGSSHPSGALSHAANNNIMGSTEIEDLNNISFGDSDDKRRLEVNFTKKILVNNNPVTLRFRYKNMNGEVDNDKVKIRTIRPAEIFPPKQYSHEPSNGILEIQEYDETDKSGHIHIDKDDADGWRNVILYPTGGTGSQDVYVWADEGNTPLYRKITFLNKQAYSIEETYINGVSGEAKDKFKVYNMTDEEFVLTWKIPENLPSAIFPLKFNIETNNKNLNMAEGEDLAIEYGKSNVTSRNTYFYVKTLTYDYYKKMDRGNVLTCRLKLIKNDKVTMRYFDAYEEYIKTHDIDKYLSDSSFDEIRKTFYDEQKKVLEKSDDFVYISNEYFETKELPMGIKHKEVIVPLGVKTESGVKTARYLIPDYIPYVYDNKEVSRYDINIISNQGCNKGYKIFVNGSEKSPDDNGTATSLEVDSTYGGKELKLQFESSGDNIFEYININNYYTRELNTHCGFCSDKLWIYQTVNANNDKVKVDEEERPVYRNIRFEYPDKEFLKIASNTYKDRSSYNEDWIYYYYWNDKPYCRIKNKMNEPGNILVIPSKIIHGVRINNKDIVQLKFHPVEGVAYYVGSDNSDETFIGRAKHTYSYTKEYYDWWSEKWYGQRKVQTSGVVDLYMPISPAEGCISIDSDADRIKVDNIEWISWKWEKDKGLVEAIWEYECMQMDVETFKETKFFPIRPIKYKIGSISGTIDIGTTVEAPSLNANEYEWRKYYQSWGFL